MCSEKPLTSFHPALTGRSVGGDSIFLHWSCPPLAAKPSMWITPVFVSGFCQGKYPRLQPRKKSLKDDSLMEARLSSIKIRHSQTSLTGIPPQDTDFEAALTDQSIFPLNFLGKLRVSDNKIHTSLPVNDRKHLLHTNTFDLCVLLFTDIETEV